MPAIIMEQIVSTTAIPKKHIVEDTGFSCDLWLNPEIGNLYPRVERITGPFATPLLHMAGIYSITKPIKVLDMCCGTGVVSAHLQQIVSSIMRKRWLI
jgi:hypothetical protein